MNYSIIIYIIGMILEIEAVFMTLPAITALIYQETSRSEEHTSELSHTDSSRMPSSA